ncbi:hypothetical protein [Solidesulfovibrio sp.]|uniref:hypothetical protein n=1 Tax=Solidesulfovibrio sp. TaxID=2910990 RepID=UPI002624145B|nr:hypothetical protein [Solidesulfovibrio sp.]
MFFVAPCSVPLVDVMSYSVLEDDPLLVRDLIPAASFLFIIAIIERCGDIPDMPFAWDMIHPPDFFFHCISCMAENISNMKINWRFQKQNTAYRAALLHNLRPKRPVHYRYEKPQDHGTLCLHESSPQAAFFSRRALPQATFGTNMPTIHGHSPVEEPGAP